MADTTTINGMPYAYQDASERTKLETYALRMRLSAASTTQPYSDLDRATFIALAEATERKLVALCTS